MASSVSGEALTVARGCTNGFAIPYITEIDPELGNSIYEGALKSFWEDGKSIKGWREFPRSESTGDYYIDPDSGPVIFEIGSAATGLGIGMARSNGDQIRSTQLCFNLLATSLPLPSGRLLVPGLVSDEIHAPLFPEIVLLQQLSMTSAPTTQGGSIPILFWVFTLLQLFIGILFTRFSYRILRRNLRPKREVS